MMPVPGTNVLPTALLFVPSFSGPREIYRGPWGGAKQGNAKEETSGEVHWETHDTRIALCKYAGIVLCRIS